MTALSIPARGTALLLIDVINDLDFKGSGQLITQADGVPSRTAEAPGRARRRSRHLRERQLRAVALMRGLTIVAPDDCIVSNTEAENAQALRQIRIVLKARIAPSTRMRFT